MNLFYPHIFAAVITTSLSLLWAYAGYQLSMMIGLDPAYPLCGIGLLWLIGMGCIAWIARVRAIEYRNLTRLIAPASSGRVLQSTMVKTVDRALKIPVITGEFFLKHIQKSKACRGRQEVVIAVIMKQMDKTEDEARKIFARHHVTSFLGTSWHDYFKPGW